MAPEKTKNDEETKSKEDGESSEEKDAIPFRNLDQLYCQTDTVTCATQGLCVPCAYKIGNFDIAFDKSFYKEAPNQRPESCPRIKEPKTPAVGTLGYRPGMQVLTCGDGDLSFSLAVSRILFQGEERATSKVVATSYEEHDTLAGVYPTFDDTLKELNDLGSKVLYKVDATNLKESLPKGVRDLKFDRIVWNFPCTAIARGQDGQNEAMEENKELVRRFVNNARPFLAAGGEIHMCHKTKPPFNQWKLEEVVMAACKEGPKYMYFGRIVLDRAILNPYTPRKALDKKSFPCHDACIYVFSLKKSTKGKFPATIRDDDESVQAVTPEVVVMVRNAQLVKAKYESYNGKKKRRPTKKPFVNPRKKQKSRK